MVLTPRAPYVAAFIHNRKYVDRDTVFTGGDREQLFVIPLQNELEPLKQRRLFQGEAQNERDCNSNGELVCPCQRIQFGDVATRPNHLVAMRSTFPRCRDHGLTWTTGLRRVV